MGGSWSGVVSMGLVPFFRGGSSLGAGEFARPASESIGEPGRSGDAGAFSAGVGRRWSDESDELTGQRHRYLVRCCHAATGDFERVGLFWRGRYDAFRMDVLPARLGASTLDRVQPRYRDEILSMARFSYESLGRRK